MVVENIGIGEVIVIIPLGEGKVNVFIECVLGHSSG